VVLLCGKALPSSNQWINWLLSRFVETIELAIKYGCVAKVGFVIILSLRSL
jgi:hypothetical protein